jgi:hypothetical protein
MSPEQAKGIAFDGKSDVYSLGVLAYAMVARTTPFESEASSVEVLHAHISKPPKPPSEIVKDLPPALDLLILQMLEKAPEDRPGVAEIRRRLKNLGGDGFETFTSETPLPPRAGTIPPPRTRKSRLPILLGAGAIVVGIGIFAVTRAMRGEQAPADAAAIVAESKPLVAPPVVVDAAPAPGVLEITVEPAAATITVDGQPVTLTDGRGRLDVAPGDHTLMSVASGYRAAEQSVAVTSGAVTPVSAQGLRTIEKKGIDAVVDPFNKKKKRR